jgi:crotonobetainyl-CoA:carnitine CoA-transferase CaiB-like acyl-CoA transferase
MRLYRPLRGTRVLSLEAAFSLPAATRMLSELGAEVVRVGRPVGDFPPFTHRTDGSAINKRSISINLEKEEGRDLALRLASVADVVCNNFRPHFLRRLGLTYEALSRSRPEVIVLQLSGYGTPGPWENIGAFGPSVEAAGGMDAAIGQPHDPPTKIGSTVFADQTAGRYAALAVAMALEERRVSGRGRYIDLSMYEGIAHVLGDLVVGAARAGKAPPKRGNRSSMFAPQGIYLCRGEEEWLALTVRTDLQWQALCRLLQEAVAPGEVEPLQDLRLVERMREHDRIDRLISAWTMTVSKEEAADRFQQLGIPAGPVQKVSDMPFDPQLRFRESFQTVTHTAPVLGYRAHPHLTLAWRSEGFDRPPLEDARPDGADNLTVLQTWLGLGEDEIAALEERGALMNPPLPKVEIGNRPRTPADPDFAARLGLEAAQEVSP